MSRYRHEEAGRITSFVDIVAAILDLDGEFRLRISSLEPDGLDEPFAALFSHPKMCPHLHLCLQSGSDRILLAMRRMYTISQYRAVVERLRSAIPNFNITTDLIVGFPGETEEDFQRSLRLVEEMEIGHVHMFPYSVRAGTRAGRMGGHITNGEKARRGRLVQEAAERRKLAVRRSFVGGTQTVLVEHVEKTAHAIHASGFGEHYIPVRITAPPTASVEHNRFYRTRITGIDEDGTLDLLGTLP
ncbi:MAG: radical SAM protein [Spirochaetales bacterium]|nr:radical SAM protein [Spirochaetales bacterium]